VCPAGKFIVSKDGAAYHARDRGSLEIPDKLHWLQEEIVAAFVSNACLLSRKMAGIGVVAACLVLGPAQWAAAQSGMTGHSMGMQDEVPPDKLPAPLKLSGAGNVHVHITATPEAQIWFDQGLNLLHDFWDYESLKAFEQGIRVDPQCAMCYWGVYQAETAYHSTAKYFANQALNKAESLKRHVSKAERLYIEAGVAHEAALKAVKDAGKPDYSKEVQIWRKLVKSNPKDTQARIFLAETLRDGYDDAGDPRAGQKEALAILQSVLKDEPENSAANHYWIHAVEASPHPEQALRSAEILGRLAPASGHIVHMPGHIFYRTGDYARAQKSFEASMDADELYMEEQHVQPDDDWNYVHNLMYAVANLMEEGQLKEATALSSKLTGARGQLEATLYPWSARDSISRLDPRLPVALRTADWGRALELLKLSELPVELTNLGFLARGLTEFAAGMHAVDVQDMTKAEESSIRLDGELWRISQQQKDAKKAEANKETKPADVSPPKMQLTPDALPDPLVSDLSVMSLELRAALLMGKKKTEDAKRLFEQAAQEEKALGYREPPIYIRPVGETEAAAWMLVGEWTSAKAAYERALLERPRSGFPLYGIAMTSEQAGDVIAARAEYADFMEAWKGADHDLPQLTHARAFLAEHAREAAHR
jgi:tetratricopeptide (TPR) repeat protein